MNHPLAWDVHGERGPFVLMVHGILSSRAQWQPNLPALTRVARPVRVELIGHGRSSAPTDPQAYRPAAYFAAFEAIRAELGVDRWFVCGQSFAAGLVIGYALAHPERVLGHLTTNSMSAFATPAELEAARGPSEQLAAIEAQGADAIRRLPVHPRFARRLPADLRAELEAANADMPAHALAHALRITLPELSVIDAAPAVRPPGLLVNGLWERAFQPLRARLGERVPHWRIIDLEGGHAVNVEASDGFDTAATDFITAYA